MGAPMAGHAARAGHLLTVWARRPEQGHSVMEAGAAISDSLQDLAKNVDVLVLCVGGSQDVLDLVSQALPWLPKGALVVDHSTIDPSAARDLHAQCLDKGVEFLDAPVTGGSMGAVNGQLTIFCGGSQGAYIRASGLFDSYAKRHKLVGLPGSGQTMKAANQIAVGGALLALCESLAFAEKAGLDLETTRELLAGGAAGSWAFDNYGPRIVKRDWSPGFSVKNQRKDFRYVKSAAEAVGAAVPCTMLVDSLLARLDNDSDRELATTKLFEIFEKAEDTPWT